MQAMKAAMEAGDGQGTPASLASSCQEDAAGTRPPEAPAALSGWKAGRAFGRCVQAYGEKSGERLVEGRG